MVVYHSYVKFTRGQPVFLVGSAYPIISLFIHARAHDGRWPFEACRSTRPRLAARAVPRRRWKCRWLKHWDVVYWPYVGFQKWGYPKLAGWFIVENPMKEWMMTGVPPFQEMPICLTVKYKCLSQFNSDGVYHWLS